MVMDNVARDTKTLLEHYLDKKAVTRAAPTPTAASASHEPPPFLASTISPPILFELNLSGTLAQPFCFMMN
uniref:Uncharacterized protein n=1 Tax=Amphimedon queenslandica TaxID=400682 RepID=A0A1X7UA71_AMPQE